MSAVVVALIAFGVAWILAGTYLATAKMRRPWLRSRTGSPVIVHCRDGASIQGVLLEAWHDGVLLAAPKHLGEGAPAQLAGQAYIGRDNIAFVQVL